MSRKIEFYDKFKRLEKCEIYKETWQIYFDSRGFLLAGLLTFHYTLLNHIMKFTINLYYLFVGKKGRIYKTSNKVMLLNIDFFGWGYDLLKKKVMDEKLKRLKESSFTKEVIFPLIFSSQHEK